MHSHPRQLVNAVYGGTELLMFDIDKVITTIDFEVRTMDYIRTNTR